MSAPRFPRKYLQRQSKNRSHSLSPWPTHSKPQKKKASVSLGFPATNSLNAANASGRSPLDSSHWIFWTELSLQFSLVLVQQNDICVQHHYTSICSNIPGLPHRTALVKDGALFVVLHPSTGAAAKVLISSSQYMRSKQSDCIVPSQDHSSDECAFNVITSCGFRKTTWRIRTIIAVNPPPSKGEIEPNPNIWLTLDLFTLEPDRCVCCVMLMLCADDGWWLMIDDRW